MSIFSPPPPPACRIWLQNATLLRKTLEKRFIKQKTIVLKKKKVKCYFKTYSVPVTFSRRKSLLEASVSSLFSLFSFHPIAIVPNYCPFFRASFASKVQTLARFTSQQTSLLLILQKNIVALLSINAVRVTDEVPNKSLQHLKMQKFTYLLFLYMGEGGSRILNCQAMVLNTAKELFKKSSLDSTINKTWVLVEISVSRSEHQNTALSPPPESLQH